MMNTFIAIIKRLLIESYGSIKKAEKMYELELVPKSMKERDRVGGFVRALAIAIEQANDDNKLKLKKTFPEIWDKYKKLLYIQTDRKLKEIVNDYNDIGKLPFVIRYRLLSWLLEIKNPIVIPKYDEKTNYKDSYDIPFKIEKNLLDKLKKRFEIADKIDVVFRDIPPLSKHFVKKINLDNKTTNLLLKNNRTIDFFAFDGENTSFFEAKSRISLLSFKQITIIKKLVEKNYKCYLLFQKDLDSDYCEILLNELDLEDKFLNTKIKNKIVEIIGLDNWLEKPTEYDPKSNTGKAYLSMINYHKIKIKQIEKSMGVEK